MNLSQILKRFLFERDLTPTDLAKAVNMSVPTIHRIVTGKTKLPHRSSLEDIAKFFGVSPNELIGDEESTDGNHSLVSASTQHIPLLEWGQINNQLANPISAASQSRVAVSYVSDKAFALEMNDCSMEPLINPGCLCVLDPAQEVADRQYALVRCGNIYAIRQVLIDLNDIFVKSLNQELGDKSIKLLLSDDAIIAKLIEIRRKM